MNIVIHLLSKKASQILTGTVARYISYYKQAKGKSPDYVTLSPQQWADLQRALAASKQSTENIHFNGVLLVEGKD